MDKPTTMTVADGARNVYAKTVIAYDSYTAPSGLSASSGAVNHDSAFGMSYTLRGNPTSFTRYASATSSLTTYLAYEDTGNVIATVDANGNRVTTSFGNCADSYPSSVGVPGGTEAIAVECARGLTTAITDANNKQVQLGFDAEGRLTSTSDPDGGGSTVAYNSPTETEATTTISSTLSSVRYAIADDFGRPAYSQTQAPSGCDTVETAYDSMGRAFETSTPYSTSCGAPSAASQFTTLAFDALGRLASSTAPDASATTYTYTANAAEITGPTGVKRILESDGWGELWQVCEVSGQTGSGNCNLAIGGSGFLTQYTYNPAGKLTAVNEAGQARSFAFDWLGRMTSESNPESGTTQYTFDSDAACGTGTDLGDIVKRVDAMGNVTCYAHDGWHRLTGITYPSGPYNATAQKTFVYDAATVDGVAMANAAGRLAEAYTGPSGSKITDEGFGFDAMGRASDLYEWTQHSAGWYHVTEGYSFTGVPTLLAIPGVPTITYGLDVEGRVTSVSAASGQNPVSSVAYDTWSHATGVSFGSGDSDAFGFDAKTGRMTSYGFAVDGQTDSGALTWNSDGSLAKLAISDPFSAGDTQTCTYSRDDLGRLSGVNCGSEWSQTFGLDPLGNTTTASGNNAFTASFSNNRFSLFNGWAPNYDADGNLLDSPLTQVRGVYGWDADGKPVVVDGVSQTFDALGRLVYNSESPAEFVWTPTGEKVANMNGQTLNFANVPVPGGGNAVYNGGGLWLYEHADWLGSVRLVSTPSRGFYGNLAYSPYGTGYAGSGPNAFTGQWVDTPDNLSDFPNRLLQATMARWLSPDPAGLAAVNPGAPQSWNAYSYVANEPLELADPTGLDACSTVSTPNGSTQVCHPTPPAGYDPLYSTPPDGQLWDTLDTDPFDLEPFGGPTAYQKYAAAMQGLWAVIYRGQFVDFYSSWDAATIAAIAMRAQIAQEAADAENTQNQKHAIKEQLDAHCPGCTGDFKHVGMQGGHVNVRLSGWNGGEERFGSFSGSLHIHWATYNGVSGWYAHVDTANPLFGLPALIIHAVFDVGWGSMCGCTLPAAGGK